VATRVGDGGGSAYPWQTGNNESPADSTLVVATMLGSYRLRFRKPERHTTRIAPTRQPVRLIVHIGAGKTGSSSLQRYLSSNAQQLAENGILIPGIEMTTNSEVRRLHAQFFETLLPIDETRRILFYNKIRDLVTFACHPDNDLSAIVISGENLINPIGFHQLFKGLDEIVSLQIVAYIRRQDDYIISAWKQWYNKENTDFASFLRQVVGKLGNWKDFLAPWEEAVGKDRIVLRRYGKEQLIGGEIVQDFMAVMNLSQQGCQDVPRSNRSYSEALVRLGSHVPDLFADAHDNRFFSAMYYAAGESALDNRRGSSLLSLEERLAVMRAYEESNEDLKQRYFPEISKDTPLFDPPQQEDVIQLTDEERQQEEYSLLVRAVYGIADKLRSMEENG
jgi:hypothetical protein